MSFTIYHADHGVEGSNLEVVKNYLQKEAPEGFFILQIAVPEPVPCGLHGPAMGDPPVQDCEVVLQARGDRPWADRLVDRPTRPVKYVQAIGHREGDKFTLYTVYGGPLAPQNPKDPHNPDPAGAARWWSEHALSMP